MISDSVVYNMTFVRLFELNNFCFEVIEVVGDMGLSQGVQGRYFIYYEPVNSEQNFCGGSRLKRKFARGASQKLEFSYYLYICDPKFNLNTTSDEKVFNRWIIHVNETNNFPFGIIAI